MNILLFPILVPIIVGLIIYFIPPAIRVIKELLTLLTSTFVLILSIWFFINTPDQLVINEALILNLDSLSKFIFLAIGVFSFLISIYSLQFMLNKPKRNLYYGSFLWTVGASCGVAFANHLILLLVFWGFLGITLYFMVLTGDKKADYAAKKSLTIIGGCDALMLLGIAFIYALQPVFEIDKISIPFQSTLSYIAFFALLSAVFSKAGAMPFHTWLPDVAESAPISVTAFIPAALDKLLGIYLLARVCIDIFVMTNIMNLILLISGAFTIIAAVMMALVQHDMRKLLAYHAISQVGYMVIGIGTGNPVGIAGGLFHMINHAIYKCGLFLSGGAVQHQTGTTDLNKLGGLGKIMPFTFASFLICALAISGIPPINGFASKWMIYQGLVKLGTSGDNLWVIWLIAAMFGSALTLASFMKLTHTIFLGIPSKEIEARKISEANISLVFPPSFLAIICILFGIFPFALPIHYLIQPVISDISYIGIWSSSLATILILVGLAIGVILYFYGRVFSNIREENHFIGGESLKVEERITGTNFYNTIKEFSILKKIYIQAEAKVYDIYDQLLRLSETIAEFFRKTHTGVLTMYFSWIVVALILLLILLMGR